MAAYSELLRKTLLNYKNPDITRRDVETACKSFTDLRPKREDFYAYDGSVKKNLLQLNGTIPVSYKGSVCNIPVCIWLWDIYPYTSPLVYVRPTANMQIKVGQHVDPDGRVRLPYLTEWRYSISDLTSLIQIMVIVFGEETPLYSRSSSPQLQETSPHPYRERLRAVNYNNPELTEREVMEVLLHFKDLKPKLGQFVCQDRYRKQLLDLEGTIPATHRGSVFSVPIGIVILDSYPNSPPLVHVRPTSNVLINAGRNVDQDGKVTLEYLKNWRHTTYDLLSLLHRLSIAFGEEPPTRPRFVLPGSQEGPHSSTEQNTLPQYSSRSSNMTPAHIAYSTPESDDGYIASIESLHIQDDIGTRRTRYIGERHRLMSDSMKDNKDEDQTEVKSPHIRDTAAQGEETSAKSPFIQAEPRMLLLGEKINLSTVAGNELVIQLDDNDEGSHNVQFMMDEPKMLQLDEKVELSPMRGKINNTEETKLKSRYVRDESVKQLDEETEVKLPFPGDDRNQNYDHISPVLKKETSVYESFLTTALDTNKYREKAKIDLLPVFSSFSDLRPKTEDFVFNDGSTQNLLNLNGTIPVSYKDSVYNIPICIWLLDSHPYNPPIVYVCPTANMEIRSGRYVDSNGKVDIPYLREWSYPRCDMLSMIRILTIMFGEEPPVHHHSTRGRLDVCD